MNRGNVFASAMHYAAYLGVFWIFKYFFVILGDYSDFWKYIANLLSIGTPVISYLLVILYRDRCLDGRISFMRSFLFLMLVFVFASFLEMAIVCLHIYVINPAALTEFKAEFIANAAKFQMQNWQVRLVVDNLQAFYISSLLMLNMILGVFLSLIFGYFASRNNQGSSKYK